MEVGIKTMGGTDTSSLDGNAKREGVSFTSDTIDKLKQSVEKTKANAIVLAERWEKKQKEAKKITICNGCGKEFKTMAGIKRHWSGKRGKCSEKNGYKQKSTLMPTAEDRVNSQDLGIVDKATRARQAALKIHQKLNGEKSNNTKEDGFDVRRIMSYPIGNFDRVLKKATTEVLEEFVKQRFDSATGPKKVLAQNELKRREKYGG